MSSYIKIDGSLFIQDTEDGSSTQFIPVEIYSDYSSDPTNTYFRQLKLSNVSSGSTHMGISNVGAYFYISEPAASMTGQSSAFILTSGGNVGIGITSPSHRLHVIGEALVRGSMNGTTSAAVQKKLITERVNFTDKKLIIGGIDHRIPKGTIALWENKNTLPAGWSIYNASSTYFVRGSNNIGTVTGANVVTLGLDNFKIHNHTTNNVDYSGNNHTHGGALNTNGSDSTHSHTIEYNVAETPYSDHGHNLYDYGNSIVNNLYSLISGGTTRRYRSSSASFTRNLSNHTHGHSVQGGNDLGNTDWGHAHNHNYNINDGAWYHAGYNTGTTGSTGNTMGISPASKSYVFIIKQ